MRSRKSKPSIGRSRCCRCNRDRSNAGPMTTHDTERRRGLRRSMPGPASDHAVPSTPPLGAVSGYLDLIEARCPPTRPAHHHGSRQHSQNGVDSQRASKRPRFHVHDTPNYGSWLSLVERWFAELTMKRIRRGSDGSVAQLKAGTQDFMNSHQADSTPFVWTKSADEILASIARCAQRTVEARTAEQLSRITITGHEASRVTCELNLSCSQKGLDRFSNWPEDAPHVAPAMGVPRAWRCIGTTGKRDPLSTVGRTARVRLCAF
jgi:hypothetical protein